MEAQERRTSQKDIAAYIVLKCSQVTCQVLDSSAVVDLVCVLNLVGSDSKFSTKFNFR